MATTGQYGFLDNKNLLGIWQQQYEPALNGLWATQVGTVVPSTMETESYGWLGAPPQLQLLTSDIPNEEGMKSFPYFLRNQEYAVSLKIPEKDMRRDKVGQLALRIGEMSVQAAEHWNVLSAATLIANPACYDGQNLFATAHPIDGSNTQSNDLSASDYGALDVVTPTAPTPVEAASIMNTLIGHFYTLKTDKGYPTNGQAKSFTFLTGTSSIWSSFNYAANATTFAGGQTNQILGLKSKGIDINVLLIPQLSSLTTKVIALRNDGPVKALFLQDEVPVTPAVTGRDNDEFVKFRRFLFSIYASRAVGAGRYTSAVRATLS